MAGLGATVLAACGDGGEGDDVSGVPSPASSGDPAADLALFQFVGGGAVFAAGVPGRLPFGVGDREALLPASRTPDALEVTIVDGDDRTVGSPISVSRHSQDLPRAYYPLEFTLDEAGTYTARAQIEGRTAEMSFQVFQPDQVEVVGRGDAMPALVTPTVADPRGVDPMCTREPPCPLHDRTVSDLLGAGRPMAVLVATPAFCQVAICGPVLDLLLGVADRYAQRLSLVHAEVYRRPEQGIDDPDAYADAVTDLGLFFEPSLFLVDAGGTVADRLDSIYDTAELTAALDALTGS